MGFYNLDLSTEILRQCQQQALRPVPQRVNLLWDGHPARP